jgi:hypothetical protein
MEGGMRYDGINWLNLVIIAQMAVPGQAAGRAGQGFPHAPIFPSSITSGNTSRLSVYQYIKYSVLMDQFSI